MRYDEKGRELPDRTPVAVPVQWRAPPSMQEMIRTYIRRELSQVAQKHDVETFEEADDFDVEDDPVDPHTPYEAVFDPPPPPPAKGPDPDPGAAASSSKAAVGEAAEPPQAPSAGAG